MKRYLLVLGALCMASAIAMGQNYPHYTMFMYNKLIYNPAYAGHLDVTNINVYARKQWTGLDGAPFGYNVSIDGPVGNHMREFRPTALGLSVNGEKIGVTNSTNAMASYAYRIRTGEKGVLALGLQAGVTFNNIDYNSLNPEQRDDPTLTKNVRNAVLPNFGAGVYYSTDKLYLGFAIPFLLQNYYDPQNKVDDQAGRQIRTYFLSGGYVFRLSNTVKMQPQVLARYAANNAYNLPVNADANLSFFFYDRIMVGATYRTDKSIEGIIYFQLTNNLNFGYSYDYALSSLRKHNNGTHEITLGLDFRRDRNKYINPRFIKLF
jgi:type IX secretion system PorP/SprF family membrane protein